MSGVRSWSFSCYLVLDTLKVNIFFHFLQDYEQLKLSHEELKKLNEEQEHTLTELGAQLSQLVTISCLPITCGMLLHALAWVSGPPVLGQQSFPYVATMSCLSING